MPAIEINHERCKGCERCVDACPQGILALGRQLNSRGYYYATVLKPHRCIGCRICAINCPDLAIEVLAEGTTYEYFAY